MGSPRITGNAAVVAPKTATPVSDSRRHRWRTQQRLGTAIHSLIVARFLSSCALPPTRKHGCTRSNGLDSQSRRRKSRWRLQCHSVQRSMQSGTGPSLATATGERCRSARHERLRDCSTRQRRHPHTQSSTSHHLQAAGDCRRLSIQVAERRQLDPNRTSSPNWQCRISLER